MVHEETREADREERREKQHVVIEPQALCCHCKVSTPPSAKASMSHQTARPTSELKQLMCKLKHTSGAFKDPFSPTV